MKEAFRSISKRFWLALALVATTAGIGVGVASAAAGVTILTPPVVTSQAVYFNISDTSTADWRFIGNYPVYGAKYMNFTWKRYPFAPDVHGSYKVALLQNLTPYNSLPNWTEKMVSHDWADNPAGTVFLMGPFLHGFEICDHCPSKIRVTAETFTYVQTPGTDDWQIIYAPILTATVNPVTGGTPSIIQDSGVFVVNTNIARRCDASSGPDC